MSIEFFLRDMLFRLTHPGRVPKDARRIRR